MFRPGRRAASVASSIVFHRGDWLRLAVLRDVQVKAVGAVPKQQHIVDRVPARSAMRFRIRYELQTGAMTIDGARLDDHGPRGSWLARCQDGDPSFVDGELYQPRCSLLRCRSRAAPDCMTDCGSRPDCSCSSMGTIDRTYAPRDLHEVAVDGAETLTVNIRLHGCVDEKRLPGPSYPMGPLGPKPQGAPKQPMR